jgi:hypothetical protein
VSDDSLPFSTRLWFAWACLVRVLFDPSFAARAFRVRDGGGGDVARLPAPTPHPAPPAQLPQGRPPTDETSALQLLALLQREGRLVDFLQQDVASFPDADVGAAARVVHDGCAKALRDHVQLAPVRAEDEGSAVVVAAGFSPAEIRLTGNVAGSAPYKGTLVHRGWRASNLKLPTPVAGHDATVIAPAEVEL